MEYSREKKGANFSIYQLKYLGKFIEHEATNRHPNSEEKQSFFSLCNLSREILVHKL